MLLQAQIFCQTKKPIDPQQEARGEYGTPIETSQRADKRAIRQPYQRKQKKKSRKTPLRNPKKPYLQIQPHKKHDKAADKKDLALILLNLTIKYFIVYHNQHHQSSLIIFRSVKASLLQMGATEATNSPFLSSSSLKATPQYFSFLQYPRVPSTMSNATPIMSPDANCVPQLGPVELLLCLVCPLYIAHPCAPSENASSYIVNVGLQTPILMRFPLLMKSSQQYLPPSVKIQVPIVVLKPLPSIDLALRFSQSNFSF